MGGQSVDLAETGDEAWLGQALTSLAQALGASGGPEPEDGLGSASGAGGWPGTGSGAGGLPALDSTSASGSAAMRELSGREVLLGSAFHLAAEGGGTGPGLAAWGRVTAGGFDGEAPAEVGNVRIEGEVTTGILGADAEWERVLAGVALSVSEGEGTFDQPGRRFRHHREHDDHGEPLCAVYGQRPGLGVGSAGPRHRRHDHRAGGERPGPARAGHADRHRDAPCGRRRPGRAHEAGETGFMDLALKADAFVVETEADPVSNEGTTTADASRSD